MALTRHGHAAGREIDRVNRHLHGLTILKGIEVDILKDGRPRLAGRYAGQARHRRRRLHSYFDLPREAQTDRVIRAMNNPHVSKPVLGSSPVLRGGILEGDARTPVTVSIRARRGWLTADDVINTRSLAELRKLFDAWRRDR